MDCIGFALCGLHSSCAMWIATKTKLRLSRQTKSETEDATDREGDREQERERQCVIRHLFAFHPRLPGQIRLSGSVYVVSLAIYVSLSLSVSLTLRRSLSRSHSHTWPFGKLQLFDKFESFVIDTNSFQIAHTTAQPTDEAGASQEGAGR